MHDNEKKAFDDMLKRISMLEEEVGNIKNVIGIYTEKSLRRREELGKLSMRKLREIGDPLGAKDTKMSELIDEIIRKKIR